MRLFTKKIYTSNNGYPRWRDSRKLVHRTIAKIILGRKVPSNLEVHHNDGNKINFRSDNLSIMTKPAHKKLHARLKKFFKWEKQHRND